MKEDIEVGNDTSDIPKNTFYCYSDKGTCPYYREDARFKSDLYGFGYVPSAWCDYLNVNSAVLDHKGNCYEAHLLYDMCKICDID